MNSRTGQTRNTSLAQSQAEARLRDAGIRTTAARINVLVTLLNAPSALTHHELLALLAGTDRVTLYRALDSLIAGGLAHKISGDDRAFRYGSGSVAEFQNDAHRHHGHFKCTGCGKIFCLKTTGKKRALLDKMQATLESTLAPGFQSHDVELTIKGWCAHCAH